MNKREREEIRGLQGQWLFVVLGALLAIFFGLAINALYDLLLETMSRWTILVFFGVLGLAFLDIFSYLFDNIEDIRENPSKTLRTTLWEYGKYRLRSAQFWE